MNRSERIYRLHALLQEGPRSLAQFIQALEKSRATIVRDLGYMKDFMGAPIEYDRATNGYRYSATEPKFELPGLWLNESGLYALLAGERLLEQMQPGLLGPYISPLRARIRKLLEQSGHSAATVSERILLQPIASRPTHPECFGVIAGAVLEGKRLRIHYHGRTRDAMSERTVHPLRLLRYRDNWYLAAHCEQAAGLRLFSLDRIRHAEPRPGPHPRHRPDRAGPLSRRRLRHLLRQRASLGRAALRPRRLPLGGGRDLAPGPDRPVDRRPLPATDPLCGPQGTADGHPQIRTGGRSNRAAGPAGDGRGTATGGG